MASSLSCRGGATRYGSCHQEGERFRQGSAELPRVVGRGRAVHAVAVSRDVMAWSRGAGAQRGKQWANRKKILSLPTSAPRMAHGSPRLAAWPVCPPPLRSTSKTAGPQRHHSAPLRFGALKRLCRCSQTREVMDGSPGTRGASRAGFLSCAGMSSSPFFNTMSALHARTFTPNCRQANRE